MKFNELKNRDEFANHIDVPRKNLAYHLYINPAIDTNDHYETFNIPKKKAGNEQFLFRIKS